MQNAWIASERAQMGIETLMTNWSLKSFGSPLAFAVLLTLPAVATPATSTLASAPSSTAASTSACVCPVTPAGHSDRLPGSAEAVNDAAIEALVNRICTEVGKLPKEASTDDMEAAIVFAVSQSDASAAVMTAAFGAVGGCDYGRRNFAAALGRVRLALLDHKLKRGTAAISLGSASGQSAFSSPFVNVGGGSSNYSR